MTSSTDARPRPATAIAVPRRTRVFALPEMRWAAASLVLFLCGLTVQLLGGPAWPLYLAGYVAGGWEPGLAGLRALRAKTLDVDLLMVVAAIGAAAIGQVMDGGLLIVIFATSGALEALATARTEDSVRGLLDLAPETATRIDEDGTEHSVAATDLDVGDALLIRPGERIAADGVVLAGASEVDQATITGEPLPVDKSDGDQVFAGTLNGTGSLRVRVGRRAEDSVVARIAALVEQASRTKARTQLFVEKVERRYSVGMVAATIALFAIPLLWGDAVADSLLRAMTFMIVASPCAVVLATMPPLLAAIANAGRRGVLVKSAVVMERFGAGTRVAFDKTGTLTHGVPELAELRLLPGASLTEDQLLRLVAAAELPSEHPLAAAIVRAARERDLTLPVAQEFAAQPGRGVTARVDGHRVWVGAPIVVATTISESAAHEFAAQPESGVTTHVDGHRVQVGAPNVVATTIGELGRGGSARAVESGDGGPVDGVASPVAQEPGVQPESGVTTHVDGHRVQVGAANVVATTIGELGRDGSARAVESGDGGPVGVASPVAEEVAAQSGVQPESGVAARVEHRVQVGAANVVATTIDDLGRSGHATAVEAVESGDGGPGVGVASLVAPEFAAQSGGGVVAGVDGHRVQVGALNVVATTIGDLGRGGSARAVESGDGGPVGVASPVAEEEVAAQSGGGVVAPNVVATTVDELRRSGYTTSVVLVDDEPVGVLALTDQVRADAGEVIAATSRLTGNAALLLTGDNAGAAARLADQVGISDVRAGLLPEDKVSVVRELTARGERVIVVGDGVNDAPALAAAHAGVAMGGAGADLTLHAADVVIVRDDLSAVPALLELSARARRVVVANLVIAAVFITGLVLWDLLGHLPLPLGVAGHEGSTVIVGLNGLRLLRTGWPVRQGAYLAKSLSD